MTTSMNGTYTAAAGQAREATERSVEVFKKNAQTFTDQATMLAWPPTVDLTEPVAQYFQYVQKAVDLNRDLATQWAELFMSVFGTVREQAEKVTGIVKEQVDTVADVATRQARNAEHVAQEQAEAAQEVEKEQARLVRKAEREQATQAREQAREPYDGLTKAELSDILTERDLPKSGTVDELIERLVSADTQ